MKITTTGRTPERDAFEQTVKRFDATSQEMLKTLDAQLALLNAVIKQMTQQREAIELHAPGGSISPLASRLKKLQDQQAFLLAEMRSMLDRCSAENRQLGAGKGNGKEMETYAALEARAAENQAAIEREQRPSDAPTSVNISENNHD